MEGYCRLRDIAAHKYQTLRMDDIYNTATMDLPDLRVKITKLLREIKASQMSEISFSNR